LLLTQNRYTARPTATVMVEQYKGQHTVLHCVTKTPYFSVSCSVLVTLLVSMLHFICTCAFHFVFSCAVSTLTMNE